LEWAKYLDCGFEVKVASSLDASRSLCRNDLISQAADPFGPKVDEAWTLMGTNDEASNTGWANEGSA
jgi:hypothetical protein